MRLALTVLLMLAPAAAGSPPPGAGGADGEVPCGFYIPCLGDLPLCELTCDGLAGEVVGQVIYLYGTAAHVVVSVLLRLIGG